MDVGNFRCPSIVFRLGGQSIQRRNSELLQAGRFWIRISVGARDFLFSTSVQTGPGVCAASCTGVPEQFPEGKAAVAWR